MFPLDAAVSQFEKQHGQGGTRPTDSPKPTFPEEALALYHDPLLKDCAEEWSHSECRTWEERYLNLLQILAEQAVAAGDNLLATSRHPLKSFGERPYRLPPLEMPSKDQESEEKEINRLLEFPGIRLFVDRAVMTQPRFRRSRQNFAVVLQICHALEGIPLALELAAARMRAMDVGRVAERLRRGPAFLTLGGSANPQRHRARRHSPLSGKKDGR